MPAKKVNPYITVDLDWASAQLESWKKYVDDNPVHLLEDRWGKKEMPRGGHTWVVTATVEQQGKYLQDMMTRYLQLVEVVAVLREKKEAEELKLRGDTKMNRMMQNAD